MAKLKCVECLLQAAGSVRAAITILDGYAVCKVHLKAHVDYSIKKTKALREQQEKEALEKKAEGKKVEEKKLSNDPKGSTLDSDPTP